MVAVTPRAMERERLSESAFKSIAGEVRRELGELPKGDLQKFLEAQPPGTLSALAELRNEPGAVSILQGSRSKPAGFFERSKLQLSSTSVVLLRGKAITLSMYTLYEDPADLEWIRVTTGRWIDELRRLNSR
jgi:hypothetical protein